MREQLNQNRVVATGDGVISSQRWLKGSYILTCMTTTLLCRLKLFIAADRYCTLMHRSLNV